MSAKKYEETTIESTTLLEEGNAGDTGVTTPPTARSNDNSNTGEGDKRGTMYSPMQRVKWKKTKTAKRFLRETITYGFFMALFCIVTYTLRSTWTFYFTDSIRGSFLETTWKPDKDFYTVANTAEFFEWMDNVFLPTAYPETWYNGDPFDSYERQFPIWYNYLVGKIRIRQLRVKQGEDCDVSKKFQFALDSCYPAYSFNTDSIDPYGPNVLPESERSSTQREVEGAFRYRTSSELCAGAGTCKSVVTGKANSFYASDGFALDMEKDLPSARRQLRLLKENRWVDLHTRAIIIEFTLYNPNIRLICSSQFLVEFFPTGAVVTSDSIKPMSMLSIDSTKDIIIFVSELILVAAVLMYLAREFQELWRFARLSYKKCPVCLAKKCIREGQERLIPCVEPTCGREFNTFRLPTCPSCSTEVSTSHLCWKGYFQDFWNILDLVNQAFFIVVFYIRFDLRFKMWGFDFTATDEFIPFYPIAWRYSIANWFNSVNALLCFFKTFKYLGKFKSLSTLVRTISKAKNELIFFLIIFMVVFLGFALSFHLAFGLDLAGYRSWWQSLNTLFLSLLGDFDFGAMQTSNRILAPVLFILYQVLLFFILANTFIAIISGAHEAAKEEILTSRNDFLTSSLKLFYNDVKLYLGTKIGFFPQNTALTKVRILIAQLEKVDQLTLAQIDDLHIFKNEIEHNPENFDLLNKIIHDFHGKVEKDMTAKDWMLLRNSVQEWHKSKSKRVSHNIWDEDDEMEIQRNRMGSMSADNHMSMDIRKPSVAPSENEPPPLLSQPSAYGGRSMSMRASSENLGQRQNNRLGELESQMDQMLANLQRVTNMLEQRSKEPDHSERPEA